MGLLGNLRFALQRGHKRGARPCRHLDQIRDVTPFSTGCQPCLDLGGYLGASAHVHDRGAGAVLRLLQEQARQPPRHQHAPAHQIVRSMEPGEDWLWCYTDQTLVQAPTAGPAR